jgi:hypothetical protein
MREAADWCGDGTRECGGRAGEFASRDLRQISTTVHRTPRGGLGDAVMPAGNAPKFGWPAHSLHWRSRASAKSGLRARLIREKIIGHGVCGLIPRFPGRRAFIGAHRSRRAFALLARCWALALLHQPARQHGRGIFFQPGIQQLRDLLAQIGRVAKPRKLVALQGIARSRKQELPGRLGFVGAHGGLQGGHREITSAVITVNSTHIRTYCGKVCKSFAPNREQSGFTSSGLGTL